MPVNIGVNIQRSPNRINQQLREAGVEGKFPKLLLDFKDQYYLASGGSKTLANAVTHARLGNAVMTDGYGPELLDNGSFSNGTDDWTTNGSPTVSNGVVTIPIEDSATKHIEQFVTAPVGKTYIVTAKITNADTTNRQLRVSANAGKTGTQTGDLGAENFTLATGANVSFVFTPTSNQYTTIRFICNTTVNGHFVSFDNVSVREMPVLKWAPHNLLTYSEQFDNAAWTKTNTAITANAVASPDGTQTADLIKETINNAEHFILQSASVTAGVSITGFAFAKAQNRNFFRLAYGSAAGNPFAERVAWFDLSDGSLGTQPTGDSSSSITSLGDGWYLCSLTIIPDNTASIPFVLAVGDADYGSSSAAYTGDGSSGIYAWGAHVYRSDLGGMVDNPDQPPSRASYVPTTSTAVYLPRIGHHVYNGSAWVNEGLLAESEARTNLLNPSDFSTSWATTNTTQTDNDAVGPDGLSSAIKLEGDANVAAHNIKRGAVSISASTTYTLSVFAKAGTHDAIALRIDGSNSGGKWASFDLTNGLAKTGGGGTASDIATIQDMGNGWFRCSSTATTDALDTSVNPHIHLVDDYASPTSSYDATGDNVYLYGAQLEAGHTPSSYIPSSSATTTRAAETFTIPSANLPWPSPDYIGSELVTNGTFDTDTTGWTGNFAGVTLSVDNQRLKIAVSGAASGYAFQEVPTVAGKVYSLKVDKTDGTNTAWGVLVESTIWLQGPSSTDADGSYEYYFVASDSSTNLRVYGYGDGTHVFYDNISVREINPLSVSIAMDGRMTYADENVTNTATLLYWRLDTENFIRHRLRTDAANVGQLQIIQESNDVNDGKASQYLEPDVLVPYSYATRHGSTFLNLGTDGVSLTANTTPTQLADLSATDLELAQDYMGTIRNFRVWDRDIADAGLVEATNPSLEPSLSLTFEGVGTNSFVVNDWSE